MEIESVTLEGTVEAVTYKNDDSGFTVLDFFSGGELITAVGVIPELAAGERLSMTGAWSVHPSFGRQFKIASCTREMPKTAADMLTYLSCGIISGIKEKTAAKIIEKFGENAFNVIENNPPLLATIKGISLDKAEKISQEFRKRFAAREVLIALEKYGVSSAEGLRIYKAFGNGAVETVTRNPYLLCEESIGIGFDKADAIAARLPKPPDAGYRIAAGILHVLKYNVSNGHTCVPREKLFEPCEALLGQSRDAIDINIDTLVGQRALVCEKLGGREFLFLPSLYDAERKAAEHILFIKQFTPQVRVETDKEIKNAEVIGGICYNDKQRLAIRLAVEKGILILTGGPGTGKTTTLRAILRLFESEGVDVALTAPTGRAAKRMSELTGRDAQTIHRLLEVEWDRDDKPVFTRNRRNPISARAVIVDELSMVDVQLFASLLEALPIGCRLIMVGDHDQLPPVGAGNVLHDLIDSKALPVVELTEVFRQAMESLIVTNAHKIVAGEMPDTDITDKDFFFMNRPQPVFAAKTVAELCATRLPQAYGYSAFSDIQVLSPSRMGETGTVRLNIQLQAVLNPPDKKKREYNFGQRVFREGDKLMQIKNNYGIEWKTSDSEGMGIFNGDIGILEKIDTTAQKLLIRFDDRVAEYPFESAQELEHAYAVTVHKSQGNEFEAVVMPVTGVPSKLAYRNLLYTAVTRAKAMIVLVGSHAQLEIMVNNNVKARRYSALRYFVVSGEDE